MAVYGALLLIAAAVLALAEALRGIEEEEMQERLKEKRPPWRRNQDGRL